MLDKIQIVKPAEIEKRSMEIITSELNGRTWPEPEFSIVKRCIHTSADFDYADNLCFSENAANIGVEALKNGAHIVTDTRTRMHKSSYLHGKRSGFSRREKHYFCYWKCTDSFNPFI